MTPTSVVKQLLLMYCLVFIPVFSSDLALNALDKDPAASEIVRKIRRIRRKKQGDSGTEPSTPAGTTVDADFGEYPWQVGGGRRQTCLHS